MLGVHTQTKPVIINALWQYIKTNKLQVIIITMISIKPLLYTLVFPRASNSYTNKKRPTIPPPYNGKQPFLWAVFFNLWLSRKQLFFIYYKRWGKLPFNTFTIMIFVWQKMSNSLSILEKNLYFINKDKLKPLFFFISNFDAPQICHSSWNLKGWGSYHSV